MKNLLSSLIARDSSVASSLRMTKRNILQNPKKYFTERSPILKEKKPEGFKNAQKTAEGFAKNKKMTGHLLEEAVKKAERNKSILENTWKDLQALIRLIKFWIRGEYKEIPWQTIVFALAGVVYFVNPFDFVPDFIPGSGFLDDATVIGFVIKSIKNDIDHFLEWEQANKSKKQEKKQ